MVNIMYKSTRSAVTDNAIGQERQRRNRVQVLFFLRLLAQAEVLTDQKSHNAKDVHEFIGWTYYSLDSLLRQFCLVPAGAKGQKHVRNEVV
jgi:hypothetical protein